MILLYIGCSIFLAAAFYTDIRTMKIPNPLTLTSMVSGLAVQFAVNGPGGLWFGLKGLGAGFGIMLLLYLCGAVGGGDVKLFGGIGAWMGTLFTLTSLVYSILAAGLIGFVILLVRGEIGSRLSGVWRSIYGAAVLHSLGPLKSSKENMVKFPFMLAVLPGVITAYLHL
ncbi:peptidase A24 [Paenibacillus yonginensis]|uniref:Peptidase A24 n=1 Tax=Paenibacillus yonginensis TaxID=1462996 RepID=A0A1B1MWL1_9BACL|nr:A24 family peptidase [Paenibacillus yonginensis]ANS73545.1 peptidase A24 [Paenibacillus yonginensis]